jgi:Leucine-rich repeat (LRR) protein
MPLTDGILDHTGAGLTALDPTPPPDATHYLLLDDNALTDLPAWVGEPSLIQVRLDNNQLDHVPAPLQHLASLHTLTLRGNQITSIPNWVWRLPSLRVLSIGANPLAALTIPANAAPLTHLYLDFLNIEALPAGLISLTQLHTLDLGHNALTSLPESFALLAGLAGILYLHDNRFEHVPSVLAGFGQMQYLNLGDNPLGDLPAFIAGWTGLRELRLNSATLTRLPEVVGALKALHELHLRSNHLQTLPATIGDLSALRTLDLRNNRLQSIPDVLRDLPSLTRLDLRWNPLIHIPAWVNDLRARGCVVWL